MYQALKVTCYTVSNKMIVFREYIIMNLLVTRATRKMGV